MAILSILTFPHPALRIRAKPIARVDEGIQKLADDMLETLYAAPGIGLAATQVNRHVRLVTLDISETQDQPMVLVNPVVKPWGDQVETEEGCLSVPDYYDRVTRFNRAHVTALDGAGKPLEFEAEDLLAICIQHECDHLDGKLFVDYLSDLKRDRLERKVVKKRRQQA